MTREVASHWGGSLLYCELRAVRGDEQLMAAYNACCPPSSSDDGNQNDTSAMVGDTIAIAHGMSQAIGAQRMRAACAVLEEALAPYEARAHWGKLTASGPKDVRRLYGARLDAFQHAAAEVDPERKFANNWLNYILLDA